MKTALVCGGSGFIGSHIVKRLKLEGYWVRAVDLKHPDFTDSEADEFIIADLRKSDLVNAVMRLGSNKTYSLYPVAFMEYSCFDEVYQLAADMGGAGFVFTGEHDADIMHNSALINLNVLEHATNEKIFYSSSACIYPQEIQRDLDVSLKETDAYPANPDSDYGWEKLFSERLFKAYQKNYNIDIRIARFHNIYGIEGTYKGGREKAPAAMCRKVIDSKDEIEVWGTGEQTRSFLYIDDCVDAVRLLMQSEFTDPINIGSTENISINDLARLAIDISGKDIEIKNVTSSAIGVNGRNSNNELIEEVLGWKPKINLKEGLTKTFKWIQEKEKQF